MRTPGLHLLMDGTELIRRSSFGPGILFLDKCATQDMALYYAYCRAIDDCADEYAPAEARRHLGRWRKELDALHRGRPRTPMGSALAELFVRRKIPAGLLDDLWKGAWSDARPTVRFKRNGDLRLYCYQVAGSVGLACLPIFGIDLKVGTRYALALGEAFQLINILRDVAEDAQRGRLYFSLDDLALHGISAKEFLEGKSGQRGERLLYDYAWRARACLRKADQASIGLSAAGLRPSHLMRALYGRLLEQMVGDGLRVQQFRYSLSPATKALIVGKALMGMDPR